MNLLITLAASLQIAVGKCLHAASPNKPADNLSSQPENCSHQASAAAVQMNLLITLAASL